MKQKTIIADRLQPFRLNDLEYVELLTNHIENIDDALLKAIAEMDEAFLHVEEISHNMLYIKQAWERFKKSIGN